MQEMFVSSLIEIGQMFHCKKKISQYTHAKIVFPTLTLGDHYYLQYFRKLSCKYDLFWLSGSGKEDF
jgi:hypothetical protein